VADDEEVDKHSSQNSAESCVLSHHEKEFPAEDPIVDLPVHYVCLQLIAFNLRKTAKTPIQALQKVTSHE